MVIPRPASDTEHSVSTPKHKYLTRPVFHGHFHSKCLFVVLMCPELCLVNAFVTLDEESIRLRERKSIALLDGRNGLR